MEESFFMQDSSTGNHGKEAMLDFQMSWLMRLSTKQSDNIALDKISRFVVLQLLGKKNENDVRINKVEVWKEWKHIDVKAEVEIVVNGINEKHLIIIENKIYHTLSNGQLDKNSKVVKDNCNFPEERIHYWLIYGDENAESVLKKACDDANPQWNLLWFYDVVGGNRMKLTGNPIFDEFWIRKWY